MFCMWLVHSGIANLLSLPTLERDGYVCSYKTNSPWIVECPDGTILKFKRDRGLFKGFPYIDMENLQDHVFNTTNDAIADHHRKNPAPRTLKTESRPSRNFLSETPLHSCKLCVRTWKVSRSTNSRGLT